MSGMDADPPHAVPDTPVCVAKGTESVTVGWDAVAGATL